MPGVKCPQPGCSGHLDQTIESRPRKDDSIKRRRKCSTCGYRRTTYERVAMEKCDLEGADEAIAEAESQLEDIQRMWPHLSREGRTVIHAFASGIWVGRSGSELIGD